MKQQKTNAMRLLDQAGIAYEPLYYSISMEDFSGKAVSELLHIDPARFIKSICVKGKGIPLALFLLPVNKSIDWKKASAALDGAKALELLPLPALKQATGYERGCVTPLGLKKSCPILIDASVGAYDWVALSAGAKGCGMRIATDALTGFLRARLCDIS